MRQGCDRVLELTYTAWDLEGFAQDCLAEASSEWRTANRDDGFAGYWKRYSPHSPFAVHHSPPPFRWDEARRFLLRCELDAAYFHLYLPAAANGDWRTANGETAEQLAELKKHFPRPRDAVAYILDTFPIVKRKDEAKFGTYRTKDQILAIYDAMAEAQQRMANGEQRMEAGYQTVLDPPPADPRCAHPPREVRV
jgi:hypothetical protein